MYTPRLLGIFQSRFYSPEEFARYSMLTHHFYVEESKSLLKSFLADSNRSANNPLIAVFDVSLREEVFRVALVCDPPFGVITYPLMKSISRLSKMFEDCPTSRCAFSFLAMYGC